MTPTSSLAQKTDAKSDRRRRQILAAQVGLLYGNANVGMVVTLVASTVLGNLQWGVVAHPIILGWWLYMFLVSAGRFALARLYRRAAPSSYDVGKWRAGFSVGSSLAGAGWGVAGVLLYPDAGLVN